MLTELYNDKNLAREIVATQITGLYAMSTGTYAVSTAAIQNAAEQFVAHYGRDCSLYDMMLYFSHYTVEFKGVSYQFDLQDILRQYRARYVNWRRSLNVGKPAPDKEEKPRENVVTGYAALVDMCMNRMRNGETEDDLRGCALYRMHVLTDAIIEKATEKMKESF